MKITLEKAFLKYLEEFPGNSGFPYDGITSFCDFLQEEKYIIICEGNVDFFKYS